MKNKENLQKLAKNVIILQKYKKISPNITLMLSKKRSHLIVKTTFFKSIYI